MTYRQKTIEATQFDPQAQDWPSGITAASESPTGYEFQGALGRQFVVAGDYVITSPGPNRLVHEADFEAQYELDQ